MRALAHPVRVALIELFGFHETLTATQASEMLGESPANCAFHLRTLAKYGFVREAGGGRGRERPWTMANRSMKITTQQADPLAAVAADELTGVFFDRWVARARQVFGSADALPGWENVTRWDRSHVFLTAEEAAELMAEMRRITHRYEARRTNPALRPEGALPVEWSVFAAPVPEWADVPGDQSPGTKPLAAHRDDRTQP